MNRVVALSALSWLNQKPVPCSWLVPLSVVVVRSVTCMNSALLFADVTLNSSIDSTDGNSSLRRPAVADALGGDAVHRERRHERQRAGHRDLPLAVLLHALRQRGDDDRAGVVGGAEVQRQLADVVARLRAVDRRPFGLDDRPDGGHLDAARRRPAICSCTSTRTICRASSSTSRATFGEPVECAEQCGRSRRRGWAADTRPGRRSTRRPSCAGAALHGDGRAGQHGARLVGDGAGEGRERGLRRSSIRCQPIPLRQRYRDDNEQGSKQSKTTDMCASFGATVLSTLMRESARQEDDRSALIDRAISVRQQVCDV